jgi:glycosyltransferase involved in cell wall biosynthesis
LGFVKGNLNPDAQGSPAIRAPKRLSAVFSSDPPTICILALSPIADDPRVRRQAEAFHCAGWKVVAVGTPGAKSRPPEWPILTRDLPPTVSGELHEGPIPTQNLQLISSASPRSGIKQWLSRQFWNVQKFLPAKESQWQDVEMHIKRYIGRGAQLRRRVVSAVLLLRRLAVRVRPELALRIYWKWSSIHEIYTCAQRVNAGIWLANDWTTLPIAALLAREKGGLYGYDTHEFAVEEYSENPKWWLLQRPTVRAIERKFIGDAAVVSAVSSGIADRLHKIYRLPRPILTIRNTPVFEEVPFRPTARDAIQVLYHGIVVPNRGIEAAIDSVALWRSEITLTIRGPVNPTFSSVLRERISALGLEHRVRFAPPVPMTELVREAALFDVGFFALPGHSRHNELALPNKFFEYVMAGLALCTTDLPEMGRLIREYDLGVTIATVESTAIAAAVNALDPDRIDQFKRNALAAARELCWERESQRLCAAYTAARSEFLQQL